MLRNRFYTGGVEHDGELIRGRQDAIMPGSLFDAVGFNARE